MSSSTHGMWGVLALAIVSGCGEELGNRPVDADQTGGSLSVQALPMPLVTSPPDPRLPLGAGGAELVVVGTVDQVDAAFGRNERGDELILSTVTLRVSETLHGDEVSLVQFTLEGGTVGDLTLEVSDLPRLRPGDQGAVALRRSRTGQEWVPNLGSDGIRLLHQRRPV